MKSLVILSIAIQASSLSAAELPPLAQPAVGWAESLGSGAVASAEKRDGSWTFAIAGQPFAAGHAAVPAEKVLFEIGSISKVFTGLLLANAVAEGKFSLDDRLSQRLPVEFRHPETGALTLKQLATHTSCLPPIASNMTQAAGPDPYAEYDERALFEYLVSAKLSATPPCKVEYSNLAFGILGVVLEKVRGKSWAKLVEEEITGPLGMTDTVQELDSSQKERFAQPWSGDQPVVPWTFKAMAGAGALRSTLADLSRFADALALGAKGPFAKAWPLLTGDYAEAPSLTGKVGLALLHGRQDLVESYFHSGATGGFRSKLQVEPGSGRAQVILASNNAAMPEAWLFAWSNAGQPATPSAPRVAMSLPIAALDEYVGGYSGDAAFRFTIARHGDGLLARLRGQSFLPIFASAKDEFFYEVVDAQISFRRDAQGKVDALTLHQNGRDALTLRDAEPGPHFEFPEAAALAEYAGVYDFGLFQPGATVTVRPGPGLLGVTLTGQGELAVFCVGRDRFDYDLVVATITFERDEAGKLTALVLHQNGLDMRSPRRQ